ncbi:MAG: hypothetical protein ABEK04_01875, partial [Candidatus Nanohalobium sp.]
MTEIEPNEYIDGLEAIKNRKRNLESEVEREDAVIMVKTQISSVDTEDKAEYFLEVYQEKDHLKMEDGIVKEVDLEKAKTDETAVGRVEEMVEEYNEKAGDMSVSERVQKQRDIFKDL